MRRHLGVGALATLILLRTVTAFAQSAEGVWRQVDDKTGEAQALVTISDRGGVFEGRIVKLFLKPGEDENPRCDKCPGDRRNQPIIGLRFVEGMKRTGLDYSGGSILDPEDGQVYSAEMK